MVIPINKPMVVPLQSLRKGRRNQRMGGPNNENIRSGESSL
jgi:hypothetical protein